jgi:demethoxyubiquinone hydroxylase (CLK1/Coq7/Cat5 family)
MSCAAGILRSELRDDDIRMRIGAVSGKRLKDIKRGLVTFHTLELMAVNIYKYQITPRARELNRHLIAAMCNEMTHQQDFQVKLYEYGFRPGKLRWAYWIVGFLFGTCSRLGGARTILKTGVWVETKALHHYARLLAAVDWDEDTRKIIEKNQADECGHIERWKSLLRE